MDKVKVAIIGTGTISNEHIVAYQNNPNVDLYAFCDLDEAKVPMKRPGSKSCLKSMQSVSAYGTPITCPAPSWRSTMANMFCARSPWLPAQKKLAK